MTHAYPAWRPKPPEKQRCHRCHGTGRVQCPFCNGSGQVQMGTDVFGNRQLETCSACFGLKHARCKVCGGEGFL